MKYRNLTTNAKRVLPLVVVYLLSSSTSHALFTHWVGSVSQDYGDVNNWSNLRVVGGVPVLPGASDGVRVGVDATISSASGWPAYWPHYNMDNSSSPPTQNFIIGQVKDSKFYMDGGTFVQSGGTMQIGNAANIKGEWIQSGGTMKGGASSFGINLGQGGGIGVLSISSGSFTSAGMSVGGSSAGKGTINMTGGAITTAGMTLANSANGSGTVSINGGSITSANLSAGVQATSTASISIFNGSFTANGFTANNVNKDSTVTISIGNGGTLSVDTATLNTSTFSIDDGLFIVRNSAAAGTPISILNGNIITLFDAGEIRILGTDMTSAASGWIADGKIVGANQVVSLFDSSENMTRIFMVVPEPAALTLLGAAMGLYLVRRKRA